MENQKEISPIHKLRIARFKRDFGMTPLDPVIKKLDISAPKVAAAVVLPDIDKVIKNAIASLPPRVPHPVINNDINKKGLPKMKTAKTPAPKKPDGITRDRISGWPDPYNGVLFPGNLNSQLFNVSAGKIDERFYYKHPTTGALLDSRLDHLFPKSNIKCPEKNRPRADDKPSGKCDAMDDSDTQKEEDIPPKGTTPVIKELNISVPKDAAGAVLPDIDKVIKNAIARLPPRAPHPVINNDINKKGFPKMKTAKTPAPKNPDAITRDRIRGWPDAPHVILFPGNLNFDLMNVSAGKIDERFYYKHPTTGALLDSRLDHLFPKSSIKCPEKNRPRDSKNDKRSDKCDDMDDKQKEEADAEKNVSDIKSTSPKRNKFSIFGALRKVVVTPVTFGRDTLKTISNYKNLIVAVASRGIPTLELETCVGTRKLDKEVPKNSSSPLIADEDEDYEGITIDSFLCHDITTAVNTNSLDSKNAFAEIASSSKSNIKQSSAKNFLDENKPALKRSLLSFIPFEAIKTYTQRKLDIFRPKQLGQQMYQERVITQTLYVVNPTVDPEGEVKQEEMAAVLKPTEKAPGISLSKKSPSIITGIFTAVYNAKFRG